MKRITLGIFIAALFAVKPVAAQSFNLAVEHEHTLRNCFGTLTIAPEKIEYKTDHKKDSRTWSYAELKQIKVDAPTRIELASYEDQKRVLGRDRIFKFKVREGEISPEANALLMEKAPRPLVTNVVPVTEETPAFEVSIKHLHAFGGCLGTLRIYSDHIAYESKDRPSDSRHWRYGDVQSLSQSERFRFEIVTFEDKFGGPKAYSFQLREELPQKAYDYAWARVYPSKFHRAEKP